MRSVTGTNTRGKGRVRRDGGMAAVLASVALATALTTAACAGDEGPARTVASAAPQAGGAKSPDATAAKGDALAFARCMRENGMPDFPDPKPEKGLAFSPELAGSPQFKAAEKNCARFQPPAPDRPPAPDDSWPVSDKLKYAACMRENGVPSFPDPDDNGGFIFPQNGTVDPASEQFKKAEGACKQYQPRNMPHPGQMKGGTS
ncbi:hypothetical protein IMZ11_28555 [Microtetraspora sp. AC03309]|uniref:hypothetical protein n=1 Tax=Microtetraspora sp. AC03309 TaxID=2779376 RepID=UPI001E4B14DE|nr:hypothetical protein [Microtetraspora sp. AC03309]MCC5579587.1 hypothetical protein [Microtetraspora sp. AC03309]